MSAYLSSIKDEPWRRPAARFLAVSLFCLGFLTVNADAAETFESAPAAHVSEILSPKLAQSVYHTVDTVKVVGRFYHFHIESEYGQYDPPSLALLKIRVHEVRTLGQAVSEFARENTELSEQLHGQLSVRANSAIDIISRPVSTATSLAGQIAHKLDGTASGPVNATASRLPADSVAMEYVADPVMAMHRRNVAAQWRLDVYSGNPQVQEFLNEVAEARSAGQLSMGTPALARPGEYGVADPQIEAAVAMELKTKTRDELAAQDRSLLAAMGVPNSTAAEFLANQTYSPSHRARLLYFLEALKDVRDRSAFVEAAAQGVVDLQSELAFEQAAMILVRYDHHVDRVEKIYIGPQLMAAITRDLRIVYIAPVDIIYWSQPTAKLFTNLRQEAGKAGFKGWELVTAGDLTPMAKSALTKLGFTVRERFVD